MSAIPGPVYGLEVPPGDVLIPAAMDFPASFRITMAALDPTEEPEADEEGNVPAVPRSTVRLVKRAFPGLDDEDDELDEEDLAAMLGEDSEDEDDESNGGPSDPAKAKKQKEAAAIKKLLEAADDESDDEEMADAKTNGVVPKGKGKGKAKVTEVEEDEDSEDSDEDSDDSDDGADLENFVVCTLDTERNYQQPLDITVNHGEKVFFVVSGTHTVYLTGNYIMDDDEDSEDDEDEYDFDPEEMEYGMEDVSDDESDELDGVDDPRVTELDSDEEAPQLVETKKGKNKRAAEESESLDDLIAKAEDAKSKKQQKKLKNNKGEAVAAEAAKKDGKSDKKVQFAKELEQGPTGSAKDTKQSAAKATMGVKTVNGVTVDDRTIGKGRVVKNGDTVGVRYIGKLQNGKQFDANKKGKPFSFKVGKGEVIKGWETGVAGMAIGGERRLTIPPQLAYGSRGMPGIPANSTLVFDIKLLEIK